MTHDDELIPPQQVRVMQLMVVALLMGVVIFLGIAVYIVLVQNEGRGMGRGGDVPILTYLAAFALLANIPLAMGIPRLFTQKQIQFMAGDQKPSEPDQAGEYRALLGMRQTTMIIGLALLEGAAFLAVIAFLVEAVLWNLALAGVASLFMLAQFPTVSRLRAWLELQSLRLAELRQNMH